MFDWIKSKLSSFFEDKTSPTNSYVLVWDDDNDEVLFYKPIKIEIKPSDSFGIRDKDDNKVMLFKNTDD